MNNGVGGFPSPLISDVSNDVVLNVIKISPSAASVSVPIPSGYDPCTIELAGVYFSVNATIAAQKNGFTANVFYDTMINVSKNDAVSGQENSIVSAVIIADAYHNQSAFILKDTVVGTRPGGALNAVITLVGASASTFQNMYIESTSAPFAATAIVPSALHGLYLGHSFCMAKSTEKMTSISFTPYAGTATATFQGGVITLTGKARGN